MEQKTIALYMRLSREDENLLKKDESNSISNQRKLLVEFIGGQQDLKDYRILEFFDDGISGARFDRPEFQKMMDKAKAGEIQMIITKDYSRLGRDYLEVGNYMECIFPLLHIRYVSVNDHYDSDDINGATGGMGVALKNIVNMLYCRDSSEKVRSAKRTLAKQGKYYAAHSPYGYKKSTEDKYKLVPDPESACVVRMIFEKAAEGKKYHQIARELNAEGYESCIEYRQNRGSKMKPARESEVRMWSPTSVMGILFNEEYLGKVINNRNEKNMDTGYKQMRKDSSEWIVVENCHEPLVSEELFDRAHEELDRKQYKPRKMRGDFKRGLIVCGYCGRALTKYNSSIYSCLVNLNPAELNCKEAKVKAINLEDTILKYVRETAGAMLEKLERTKEVPSPKEEILVEANTLKKSMEKYSKQKFKIYDDYKNGKMSREEMARKNEDVKRKIEEIKFAIEEKENQIESLLESSWEEEEENLNILSGLSSFEPDLVRILISKIRVYNPETIEIEWNTDDFLKGL